MKTLNIIVYAVALVLAVAAYLKGEQRHILGITEASKTLLLVLPTLLGAFLIAGYVRVLVPEDVVREWLGKESGLKGVLVGYLAGTLTFGGPFISFPIAASLYHAGGSVQTVTVYITSWALWGGGIIFYEFSILGPKLFTIRMVASILFPLLAGVIGTFLAKILDT
ncbi:MAG TPA: permease [Candidatus Binatia bacterium]|nr:permease [Candidatus Binatia bacterium]